MEDLAKRLIAAVGAPVPVGYQEAVIGLSVGIALAPEHGALGEEVFKQADLALYRAKAEGRNTYRVFSPAMDTAVAERRDLESDLRRAIANDELSLHYQPQVTTGGRDLVGFEALVRWSHPVRGMVPPSVFVPLAEESGLILPLGEWVLRAACREAATWSRPLKIAVNLSPRQFQQAELAERVLAILTEVGLSPRRLELEITESVIINDMARALHILRRLKDLGISIAMDDFGTGYSSLATLQAFPFDKIKIDRAFVGHVEGSPQAAVIVKAVLGLGRSLGMGVVAEGVETFDQMRFLTNEACDEVQGYLIGRPQPIAAFARYVRGTTPVPCWTRSAPRLPEHDLREGKPPPPPRLVSRARMPREERLCRHRLPPAAPGPRGPSRSSGWSAWPRRWSGWWRCPGAGAAPPARGPARAPAGGRTKPGVPRPRTRAGRPAPWPAARATGDGRRTTRPRSPPPAGRTSCCGPTTPWARTGSPWSPQG